MNQFAPLELCQKLQEMGCVGSEKDWNGDPIFNPLDFIGPTEQARENCRKRWVKNLDQQDSFCIVWEKRYHMMHLRSLEAFWDYVGEGL